MLQQLKVKYLFCFCRSLSFREEGPRCCPFSSSSPAAFSTWPCTEVGSFPIRGATNQTPERSEELEETQQYLRNTQGIALFLQHRHWLVLFEEEKAGPSTPSSWKWIKAQSNNWGHRPEHRFEFAGAVAIGDGAARNRRAIAGGVTGVHLRRLLENLNGGLGYVLQKRIQLLQRVGSDVQILKQGSHTSVNFKFKDFPGTIPSNPRT